MPYESINCPACRDQGARDRTEGGSSDPDPDRCPQCGRALAVPAPPPGPARTAPRRPLRSIAIAATALIALAGAGTVIVRSLSEELKGVLQAARPAPTQAVAQGPAGEAVPSPDDPAIWRSPLGFARVGEGGDPAGVVLLGRPAGPQDYEGEIKGSDQGILLRELVRQSVLLAARDELGLTTCDEVLGESLASAPKAGGDAEISSVFRVRDNGRAWIRRLSGGTPATLAERPLSLALPRLVEAVEKSSRSDFPAALKTLGMKGKGNPRRPDAPLPEDIDGRIFGLGETELFGSIRELHRLMRADGESPPRIAALSRAYAVLGVLTEHHWSPAHKVFKARALLYAERLVARAPDDPFALRDRAFVRALAGMHPGARADLTAASASGKAKTGGEASGTTPDWVPLIEAFLRDDVEAMKVDSGRLEAFAALLRLLSIEYPRLRTPTINASREVLTLAPDCFRAIDMMCAVGGVSDQHVSTEIGPRVLDALVPEKLAKLEALPARVDETIERKAGGPALVEALRRSGDRGEDRGEPSWGAFGRLVAETRFVQVYRRLWFMRHLWSVPVDDYWSETLTSVAGHPFRPVLESMTLPAGEAVERLGKFLADLDLNDVEVKEYVFWNYKDALGEPATRLWKLGVVHSDALVHDLSEMCVLGHGDLSYPRGLLDLSPTSPCARATLIEDDWAWAEPRLAGWEKEPLTSRSPAILAALARQYTKMKRLDDARSALERFIKLTPEAWAFEMLAANDKTRGDMKGWRENLDRYLAEGENGGLDRARVQIEIARELMGRQRYDEAQPYAEEAAQTWAGWALDWAGKCDETLDLYDRAEFWFRGETQRYPNSFMNWFLFCKRTGYGDVDDATRWAEAVLQASAGGLSDNEKTLAILFYDLADEPERGLAFLRPLLDEPARQKPGLATSRYEAWAERMFLARFADSAGDAEFRDACWDQVMKQAPPAAVRLATLFREIVGPGPARDFDRKEVDELLDSADPMSRSFLVHFVGRFLERHGKIEDALRYWERGCETLTGGNTMLPLLCSNAVRTRLEDRKLEDPHFLRLRGRYRMNEHRWDLAIKDLERVSQLDPRDKEAIRLRGIARRNSGDLAGALDDFGKLADLAPDDPAGPSARAIVLVMQGKDGVARKEIDRAIALNPKSYYGYLAQGLLQMVQGKEAEARESFGRVSELELESDIGVSVCRLKIIVREKRKP